jgi:ParB-like chromosome segregation protein Spo0J
LEIKYLNLELLNPYANNARFNEKAVDKVASSIKNYGFKNPILIDGNNEIIAGHTRLLAAKKLGLKEVPTILVDDLTLNR